MVLTSAATLALLAWGAHVRAQYAVLPRGFDWSTVEFPTHMVGVEVTGIRHAQLAAERLAPGQGFFIADPGEVTTGAVYMEPETGPITFWMTVLCALAFWGVATFTLGPRISRPAIGHLYAAMLLSGLAILVSGPVPPRAPLDTVPQAVYLASLCFLPVFFLRFSLGFPRRMAALDRMRWLSPALFLVAGVIAFWSIHTWTAWFATPDTDAFLATQLPTQLMYGFLLLGFPAGLLCLYVNGRSAPLEREQRQTKWILVSIAIGATPFVFVMVVSRLFFDGRVVVPPVIESLGEMVVPAGITIAVVRDRFLDVDVIIRRGVIYTVLVLGAALVASLTVLLAGKALGWDERLVGALAAGLPAALFLPARRLVSGWVDRTFFKIRYSHERALADLRRALLPVNTRTEVAEAICRFLDKALAPKHVGVSVRRGEEWASCGSLPEPLVRRSADLLAPLGPEWGVTTARPHATGVPEIETDAFPDALGDAGVRIVQPIAANGALHGLMLLGEKESERRYVEEDLKLVSASALQAGRALERVALTQRVAEEAMKRRHIAELVRQKAEFFARVAHDLRTPLTAIRWSVRNLSEELAGPLNERQSEYLESVGAAAGQLGRLIDNLVDLSRIDFDAHKQPPEPVDLCRVVQDAANALRPIAEAHGASIVIRAREDLPTVLGRTEAAFQIVINLLDNALKYAPEDSAVEIEVHAVGEGLVELAVRDRGPGLPEEDRDALFDLFTRGPESPHSETKGFGIGLHIVREWTHSLGGTVTAENAPGGGARFVVRLPEAEEPA